MADIAEYTLGVGVLTVIGLALTVYYARTAAFAAVEAAEHGRTTAILYEDVFGRERETRFCWRYNVSGSFEQYNRGDEGLNRRT